MTQRTRITGTTGAGDPSQRQSGARDAGVDLCSTLAEAGTFFRLIADTLAAASGQAAALEERLARVEGCLAKVGDESQEVADRLGSTEDQMSRLMGLYVAAHQFHSTLDPAEVQATIREIVINMLGVERFALLVPQADGSCEVPLAEGLGDSESALFPEGRYVGGDSMIDATLADATVRSGPAPGSRALAVVPLIVQESVVGVLAILKLLDHKSALSEQDFELLDVLAGHAASALLTAQMHASSERKLRTLECLVSLARRG